MYVRTWISVAVDGAPPSSRCDPTELAQWACSDEAGLLRGGELGRSRRASCGCVLSTHVRPHAGKWGGGGGSPYLPPSRRAMRHARALGQRKARARQAGTARPAIAHAASLAHVPLLPRAMDVHGRRRAMAHARAAAAAPATGDFRRPRRSSRTSGAVRSTQNSCDFRRETPSIRLCPCVDKTTHAQAESH